MNRARRLFFSVAAIIVIGFICSLPLFMHLGRSPIYMWDEAAYANNALDMYTTPDLLVVRAEGQPDLYNTKPPLVLWMQTLSMYLFGLNEFAIRFPSAFFAALTMLLLLWFSFFVLQSYWTGIAAMLVLACSNGYVSNHGTRSGDLDATLVFWMTLYVLIYIKFLIQERNLSLHLAIFSAGLIGAFLSKGIAGFFFLPFLILATIVNGNFMSLLRRKEIYIAAFSVLFVCCGYYLLRERAAPGYLDVVFKSEFARYGKPVMSWHVQPFNFYFKNFIQGRFTPFIYLIPASILILFIYRDQLICKLTLYLWILSSGYFLLISYPADKLDWYDEPLYPLFALLIGMTIIAFTKKSLTLFKLNQPALLHGINFIFIALIFFRPYQVTIDNVSADDAIASDYSSNPTDNLRMNGAYMKYLHENFAELKNYTVFKSPPYDPEFEGQMKFYQRVYNLCDSCSIGIKYFEKQLSVGEVVLVSEQIKLDSVQNGFNCTTVNSWNGCSLLRLDSRKN